MTKEERIELIKERLRLAADSCDKTREQVASEVGIETRALRGYLSGDHTPTGWMLAGLCDALGVSMDWVCGTERSERR